MKSIIKENNLEEICGEVENEKGKIVKCVVFYDENGEENCDFVGLIYENGKMEVVGCRVEEEVESISEMEKLVEEMEEYVK